MAAWFNPRAVTYNSNPALVAQSGAVGDALYKLYSDARANKQEQDRQNEIKRQFDTTFDEKQRQFNANQSLKEQEMADTKTYRDNNLKLQQDALAETKRNNDMYDAYRNAQLNSQNIYHNQMINLAKDKLATSSKSNPFFTKSLLENQSAMDNLGLTTDKIKQAYELGGDDGVQALYEATKTIAKGNKDLGVDLGIKFKQIPQSSQKQISNSINLLNALSGGLSTINKNGGIDKLSGAWDKSVLYLTPSWSQTSSDYNAVVKNIADTYAENQKGNGKYNITNVTDVLTPGMFGNENVRSNMKTISEQTINELSALVKNLKSQGYNTDEVEQQLNSFTKLLTKDNIDNFLNGRYTDPEDEKTLSNTKQVLQTQPVKNQEVLNINNIDLNAIEAELKRRGL
ncbi:Uncharacterised protein [Campylobacter hyointestinalis subsp. hyointestinalis]|uniref:Uncharacterized protein n=1 Tax=Campylobacter hyointestinalis subsp. hyointestinalis TaxID=91352 RepID=A0A9W5EVE1_CAMHY|nr:hypothetical protein [Campylobacter hyointestinalis]CUU77706.1 Uncharacterised protein [Campylobacter hyointestinalis subsp. hyointestinalis]CUU91268.1 Uncharacterised protein [Campylobacter hyointestinalis subsp. hyointestinalis]